MKKILFLVFTVFLLNGCNSTSETNSDAAASTNKKTCTKVKTTGKRLPTKVCKSAG